MNKNLNKILLILFLTIFTGCSSLDVETVDTSTSTTSTQIETTTSTITSTTTSTTTTSTTIFIKTIENIEDAQSKLKELNLYNGDINGLNNSETKNAIREFQRLSGLVVDGILGPITKAALEKGEASYIAIGEGDVDTVEAVVYSAEIEDAQRKLKELNLYTKDIDGINGIGTKNAIREFQRLSGLVVDGILGPITKAALEKGEASYIAIGEGDVDTVETVVYSAEIEDAQRKLKELNLYTKDIDGINGIGTKNAIREFQRLSGLVIDGILGPITKAALEKGEASYVEIESNTSDSTTTTTIPVETSYASIGRVPTQNYTDGVNSPVNGLPMPGGANNSIVIGVKNDNNVNARPQSGPQNADAVVEVLVEGGMTRFINIFYQSDTTYHGPIRSARPTDPTVLKPLGGVLVVSGATGGLIPQIEAMGVPVITDRRPEFFRISSRRAPHNLYADTIKLKEHALSRGYKKVETPQPLFPWGDPTFSEWTSNSYLTLSFSGYTRTTWTWNGTKYTRTYYDAYKNKSSDNVHATIDINGNSSQISTDTVIALFCEPYLHPLQLPSVKTVGVGRAIIAHGGKLIDARWKRGSNEDPFHIIDSNNNILYVPKGKVWISLVPNTKSPSFG